jgi:ribosomal protein L11 methyltransferase
MGWHQFSFHVPQPRIDGAEEVMLNLGAVSVTLMDAEDQPLLEPLPGETPTWDNSIMTCLFDEGPDKSQLTAQVESALLENEKDTLAYEWIEDQAWERAWMDEFKAMQFGERLWVVPSHLSPPDESAVNMVLDPGLAFGTGTHPTTALCLRWLDSLNLDGKTIFDFGCGSGILAIAALLLGAKPAYVTDIDPQAIEATHDNAKLNKVEQHIHVLDGKTHPNENIDVFIANILAGPLEELAPHFATLCQPNTQIALSGILREQAMSVKQCYEEWFDMNDPVYEEDWTLLTGKRK